MAHGTTCTGTRSDGSPCTSAIVLPSGKCFAHDEGRRADRLAASARGGAGKSRIARVEKLVPGTLRPVLGLLLDALEETKAGDCDPKVATALAALAGAITRVYSSATVEQQIGDLEAQIARLARRGA